MIFQPPSSVSRGGSLVDIARAGVYVDVGKPDPRITVRTGQRRSSLPLCSDWHCRNTMPGTNLHTEEGRKPRSDRPSGPRFRNLVASRKSSDSAADYSYVRTVESRLRWNVSVPCRSCAAVLKSVRRERPSSECNGLLEPLGEPESRLLPHHRPASARQYAKPPVKGLSKGGWSQTFQSFEKFDEAGQELFYLVWVSILDGFSKEASRPRILLIGSRTPCIGLV